MFVQVSGTSKAAQGGLGIGLTLVKSLVELHGGSVEASSDGLGRGATFTVRLPLARNGRRGRAERPSMSQDAWMPSIERTILVVDDNRDAADSLAELLGAMGATALVAYTRRGGACASPRSTTSTRASSTSACRAWTAATWRATCARGTTPRDLTLIALTGWGQQGDRQRMRAPGSTIICSSRSIRSNC